MATLNIKNFPDELHGKLKERAERNGRSLSSEVERLLAEALLRTETYTLRDWQGVGAHVWKGVDAVAYVRKERRSWGR
jgi:plasmid stability protein